MNGRHTTVSCGLFGCRIWRNLALLGLVGAASLAFSWPGNPLGDLLRYERSAVASGEWWRLLSAHLVHGNLMHWLINISGLALVIAIFPSSLHRSWLGPAASLVLMAPPVGAALHWFNPELDWYVGLSGLLHGLFASLALLEAVKGSHIGLIGIALLASKLMYEQLGGASLAPMKLIGLPVILDAHLYGALVGGILAILAGLLISSRGT